MGPSTIVFLILTFYASGTRSSNEKMMSALCYVHTVGLYFLAEYFNYISANSYDTVWKLCLL